MLKNENKIIKKNGSNKERKKKKKSYVVWPDSLYPSIDKTVRAKSLLYSQFFITMNSSGTYTRVRLALDGLTIYWASWAITLT